MKIVRGKTYKVGNTGYTIELAVRGYIIRSKGKEVAARMSRKSAMSWITKNSLSLELKKS